MNFLIRTLHMAFVDTDIAHGIDMPKSPAEGIVSRALDGLEAGAEVIPADDFTRQIKSGLADDRARYLLAR